MRNFQWYRHIYRLADIRYDTLLSLGALGIILDLDNTIVSEDDHFLSPGSEAWLKEGKDQGLRFFILSNGKRKNRFHYWSNRLDIPGIYRAHKPSLRAYRQALKVLDLERDHVVVIGDSFHTDVLGAWCLGCPCFQVASLPHPPRWWERLLGRWVQIPYPHPEELWHLNQDTSTLENPPTGTSINCDGLRSRPPQP